MLAGSFFEVLARLVRIASIVAVLFNVAGLLGFLTDEVRNGSEVSATRIQLPGQDGQPQTVVIDISEPDPSPAVEAVRENEHTSAREFIDDVGDVLMAPFSWIADGSQAWVQRLLYSALALLIYGFLGQMLADFMLRESAGTKRAAIAARERAAAEERTRTGSYQSPA
jgi:hypothetical protein